MSLRKLSPIPLLLACTDPYRGGEDDVADTQVTTVDEDSGDANTEEDTGPGCQSDEDCMAAGLGTVCDTSEGQCWAECIPGQSMTCYDGPEGTAEIGICKIGSKACQAGEWPIECDAQVVPAEEDCENGLDDDCDGNVDAADKDGDGFLSCIEGELADCCDEEITDCINAHLVNPGAFEVAGNDVDDDCDGMTDEDEGDACDDGLYSGSSEPLEYAQAIDLCATTTLDDVNWGVISGVFSQANGSMQPYAPQRSIRPQFGANLPMHGASLAVLSSGHAAASGQSAPNFAAFEQGTDFTSSVAAPILPPDNSPPCPAPAQPPDGLANDSIMLSLDVRVPTNARSFSAKFFFFSAEYPEWVCSEYNDFFVALVDSESDENPADGNIAVFDDGEKLWPVGVNIAAVAPELFTVCKSGSVGCQASFEANFACSAGPELLMGTGFDVADSGESCNLADPDFPVGGGTGWLEMHGNVEPGEVMTIRFAIWDGGGHKFDSVVLIDDWQWSLEAASPGIDPVG